MERDSDSEIEEQENLLLLLLLRKKKTEENLASVDFGCEIYSYKDKLMGRFIRYFKS